MGCSPLRSFQVAIFGQKTINIRAEPLDFGANKSPHINLKINAFSEHFTLVCVFLFFFSGGPQNSKVRCAPRDNFSGVLYTPGS